MAQECSEASTQREDRNNNNMSVESRLLLEREIFRMTLASYLNQFQEVLHNTCQAYEAQIQQLNDRNSECSEKTENTVSQKMEKIIGDLIDARMCQLSKSAGNSLGETSGSGAVSQLTAPNPPVTEAPHKETIPESFPRMLIPSVNHKEERDPAMEELWAQLNEKCAAHHRLSRKPTKPESLRMAVDVIAQLEKELNKDNKLTALQDILCRANVEIRQSRSELDKVRAENLDLKASSFERYARWKLSADEFPPLPPGFPSKNPRLRTVSPNTHKKALQKLALARDSTENHVSSVDLRREMAWKVEVNAGGSQRGSGDVTKVEVNAEGQRNSTQDSATVCQQNSGGSLHSSLPPPRPSPPQLSSAAAPVEQRPWTDGMVIRVPMEPGEELYIQMDISIAEQPAGHIVLKLYRDNNVREVTDMFLRLCVRYACSFRGGDIFHVVPGRGMWFRPEVDKSPNGGSCPERVPLFPKYTGFRGTYKAGLLAASAGCWPWCMITLGTVPTVDSACVGIGEVVKGMDVIGMIEACGSESGQQTCPIVITHCRNVFPFRASVLLNSEIVNERIRDHIR